MLASTNVFTASPEFGATPFGLRPCTAPATESASTTHGPSPSRRVRRERDRALPGRVRVRTASCTARRRRVHRTVRVGQRHVTCSPAAGDEARARVLLQRDRERVRLRRPRSSRSARSRSSPLAQFLSLGAVARDARRRSRGSARRRRPPPSSSPRRRRAGRRRRDRHRAGNRSRRPSCTSPGRRTSPAPLRMRERADVPAGAFT